MTAGSNAVLEERIAVMRPQPAEQMETRMLADRLLGGSPRALIGAPDLFCSS